MKIKNLTPQILFVVYDSRCFYTYIGIFLDKLVAILGAQLGSWCSDLDDELMFFFTRLTNI